MPKDKIDELISANLKTLDLAEPADVPRETETAKGRPRRIKRAKWIPIEQIHPDPGQPRKRFEERSLAELAQSIKAYGVRQPIVVEYVPDRDRYQIVSGERRYRAAHMVRIHEMPCIVQEQAEQPVRFAQQLIENIHREDFNPLDKARALLEYKTLLGNETPWSEVERKIGISETRRKQFVALLNLPEDIQNEIVAVGKRPSKHEVTEKHARALLLLNKMPEQQADLFRRMVNRETSMTGDEALAMARGLKGEKTVQVFKVTYQTEAELIAKLTHALSELKKRENRERGT